jgi:DNA-binding NtrC family response regulator
MSQLLISEQRLSIRRRLVAVLRQRGYSTVEANDRDSILRQIERSQPQMVVLGLMGTGTIESIELAVALHSKYPGIPVVLFAADSSEELAILALKAGVRDYVRQPACDDLACAVDQCLRAHPASEPQAAETSPQVRPLLGQSAEMKRIRDYVSKVAAADCNVLITGETGTGKELVAEQVHFNSSRRNKPFIPINCAAIPDGLLESELFGYEPGAFTGAVSANSGKFMLADGGTVFLDEIGDMSLFLQAKILRAIESKEVQRLGSRGRHVMDVRIVAATNQSLERLIRNGKFRADLYFRISVTQVNLPPLRERREDIPLLLQHFIEDLNRRLGSHVQGIRADMASRLLQHSWPGNVRELKNLVETLFVTRRFGWFATDDLPHHLAQLREDASQGAASERALILSALETANWNKSDAARELHWCRMTLYRKMVKYQIAAPASRRAAATASGSGLGITAAQ